MTNHPPKKDSSSPTCSCASCNLYVTYMGPLTELYGKIVYVLVLEFDYLYLIYLESMDQYLGQQASLPRQFLLETPKA